MGLIKCETLHSESINRFAIKFQFYGVYTVMIRRNAGHIICRNAKTNCTA